MACIACNAVCTVHKQVCQAEGLASICGAAALPLDSQAVDCQAPYLHECDLGASSHAASNCSLLGAIETLLQGGPQPL